MIASESVMSESDLDRVLDLYSWIASGKNEFLQFTTIPGPPPSKARPRFGNRRTYKDPKDTANEQRTRSHLQQFVAEPHTGNVALACVFFRPNSQRIDTDNMLKHVCDAANGVLWIDDSQVTAIVGMAELDPVNPRTLVVVGRHESTLLRGTDNVYPCAHCGVAIPVAGQTNRRKTCSKECAARSRGFTLLSDSVPCAHCGEPFKRTTTAQILCSAEFRRLWMIGRRRLAAQRSRCLDCNAALAHNRGGRCRDCWRDHIGAGVTS